MSDEPIRSEELLRLDGLTSKRAVALRDHGFRLDDWFVEPRSNRLTRGGAEVKLDPRVMKLLVHLAARGGAVVTRVELGDVVWSGAYISENTVSQAVSRLRKALGDDRRRPRFIETISKSGYRLVASVQPVRELGIFPPRDAGVPTQTGARPPGALRRLWLVLSLLFLGVVVLVVQRGRRAESLPSASATPRVAPELTLNGNQFEPVLSPSGDHVAFCWRDSPEAPWSVWVQRVGGDSPVRLTHSMANERLPTWSPDGQSIAYVRYTQDLEEPPGIFRSELLGASSERLADLSQEVRSLHWSPDGQSLAMSVRSGPSQPLHLELLDLATGLTTVLTSPPANSLGDRGPMFSPEGDRLVFERRLSEVRHDVMVLDLASLEIEGLTADSWGQVRGVDWRSDGGAVFFSSNRSGQFELWSVSSEGGAEPQQLPIQDTWVTQPSVSRRGGRLLYRTFRDVVGIWSLSLAALSEEDPEPVVSSTRSERQPSWSPTGDKIAFLSDRSGSTEIWSAAHVGSGLKRHTAFSGPLPGSPVWSPNGQRLLFDVAVDGHSDLWEVGSESRQPRRLTEDPTEEQNPTFSRDGSVIYFASDRSGSWEIWRMPTTGGPASQVTEGGGFLAQESFDGVDLFYVRVTEPGIWKLAGGVGDPERVVVDLDLADWGSWAVSQQGLYFLSRRPTSIQFLDFATGTQRLVFSPLRQVPLLGRSLSLSPDGETLLFSMIEHSDDEVMRVDLPGL